MKVLDRLPIIDRPQLIDVRGELLDVHRNQIIVWLSIENVLRPFPALLDTGHGHNLSIGTGQLARWSGATLQRIGELQVSKKRVVQYEADVRLHRNKAGRAELTGESYALEMPQGITVMEDHVAPRLPLIGLRAFLANRLKVVIDGKTQQVTVTD